MGGGFLRYLPRGSYSSLHPCFPRAFACSREGRSVGPDLHLGNGLKAKRAVPYIIYPHVGVGKFVGARVVLNNGQGGPHLGSSIGALISTSLVTVHCPGRFHMHRQCRSHVPVNVAKSCRNQTQTKQTGDLNGIPTRANSEREYCTSAAPS